MGLGVLVSSIIVGCQRGGDAVGEMVLITEKSSPQRVGDVTALRSTSSLISSNVSNTLGLSEE